MQILHVYIFSNINPCQPQLILNYVLLWPISINHPKRIKLSSPSKFVWFEEIPCFYFILGRRKEHISSPGFLLGHKHVGKSLEKTISNMENRKKRQKGRT